MGNLADSFPAAFAARPDPAAVPAVSIAVVQDRNEVVAAWGADNRTLFQAASISKPVAALMALRLTAQGKLSLDADVNEYLTSLASSDPMAGSPLSLPVITLTASARCTAPITTHLQP